MKILSLELFGYNRFNLSNISKFKITATTDIQIIIGTNGSGKSSLLEALSPYPQPKSDFINGGNKTLEIEHNNSHYLLVSEYNGVAKHQFIKDGINLNEGRTFTVQKELVEKELGFNNHLHELLTGKLTFTDMSALQRRDWIMRISDLDLKYALESYDKVRNRLRDSQGALKHSELRLGRESQKLLDDVNIDEMKKENQKLQEQISYYLSEKKNNLPNLTDIENEYKSLSSKIEALSSDLLKSKFIYIDKTKVNKLSKIIEIEQGFLAEDKSLKAVLKEQEVQLKEYKDTLKQLRDDGAVNIKGLENKLTSLYEIKSKILPVSDDYVITGDTSMVLKDTISVRFNLSELVAESTGDSIDVPDKQFWDKYKENLKDINETIQSVENRLVELNRKKRDMENSHQTECPKCKYKWKPGISEKELTDVKEKILTLTDKQSKLITERKLLLVQCENIDIRNSEINRFRAIAHSYPRLRSFWNSVAEKKYIYNNPKDIMSEYSLWLEMVNRANRLDNLNDEIDASEAILSRLKNIGDEVDIDFFVKKERVLSDKIEKTLLGIERNTEKLTEIKKYKNEFQKIADKVNTLVGYVKRLKELEFLILDGNIQREISTRLNTAQLNLSNNKRKQTEAETLNGIINDLKENITELKDDIASLTYLEKALSPTDGIIAESVTGFIGILLSQLNELISKVWEYDMKILPCSKSEKELDYKFPLEVMNKEKKVSDISKGSSGQKEMINFIFTLAVRTYLDLKDFPLFLDEIGSKFDEAHKSNLVMFIRWLMDSGQCAQIWMISHFASDHGGLVNSEVCVMDPANVTLPDRYNEHVVIS